MKRYGNLYPKIYDFANIERAYKQARKCKRYRVEVLKFTANKEENLINIQNHLIWHSYRQGAYRVFKILEPKERIISALPFTDRVIQHAICNVIEPLIDKRFFYYSCACRKGRGMHMASDTITRWLRNMSYGGKPLYALKGDIHHYFQSIDHGVLKKILRRIFKDKELLWLLDLIIDSNGAGAGIPVGNLTSQLFANLYLNELDRFAKETLHVRHYIRYMDDFIIISDDKAYLRDTMRRIEGFLLGDLHLSLNPKTTIINTKNGVDFCGYIHWLDHKKVRKTSVQRMRRTIEAYRHGKISKERLQKSLQSWLGHIAHADTYRLRERILRSIDLKMGGEALGNRA